MKYQVNYQNHSDASLLACRLPGQVEAVIHSTPIHSSMPDTICDPKDFQKMKKKESQSTHVLNAVNVLIILLISVVYTKNRKLLIWGIYNLITNVTGNRVLIVTQGGSWYGCSSMLRCVLEVVVRFSPFFPLKISKQNKIKNTSFAHIVFNLNLILHRIFCLWMCPMTTEVMTVLFGGIWEHHYYTQTNTCLSYSWSADHF